MVGLVVLHYQCYPKTYIHAITHDAVRLETRDPKIDEDGKTRDSSLIKNADEANTSSYLNDLT